MSQSETANFRRNNDHNPDLESGSLSRSSPKFHIISVFGLKHTFGKFHVNPGDQGKLGYVYAVTITAMVILLLRTNDNADPIPFSCGKKYRQIRPRVAEQGLIFLPDRIF